MPHPLDHFSRPRRIVNIQMLRFIAAFWVAFYHARVPVVWPQLAPHMPHLLTAVQKAGFGGVDIFFVISGVVMALTTHDTAPSPRAGLRFLLIRYARIYIGWWPFFMLYLLAFSLRGPLGQKSLLGSFFLAPMGLEHYLVPVIWTLSFELFFYTFIAVLLPFDRRLRVTVVAVVAALLTAFVGWSMTQGFYTPARFHETWPLHQFIAFPLIGEFLAGFLLYEWVRARQLRWVWPWLLGAVALLAIAVYFEKHFVTFEGGLAGYYYAPQRALLVGGFALCLVAAALIGRPWFARLGVYMERWGDASYAIYLCHILVLASMSYLLVRIGWPPAVRTGAYVLMLIAVVVYSLAHFRWIESPLYRAARRGVDHLFPATPSPLPRAAGS